MERYTGGDAKGRRGRIVFARITLSLTITCSFLSGCDPVGPRFLRFGSDGLVRVTVEVPLQTGIGWMDQVLTWKSDGAWNLFEEIGYEGVVGDDRLLRNPGLPYRFAANYLSLLHLVNDNSGTKLWGLQERVPECGTGRSRVSFLIRDNMRDEQREWSRCAPGATSLRALTTRGSDPDDGSARVVQVAMRARDFTLGANSNRYAYTGSLPFATLERGTKSGMDLTESTLYRSTSEGEEGEAPREWLDFWKQHTGSSGQQPPQVDWSKEMVIVAAVGIRDEVGDSVEVRRVLQVGKDLDVKFEIVERVPGDYCAPATRIIRPYHIAVTPRSAAPVSFGFRVERVPCGV